MLPETELLQYIHKTAEMGCEGIQAVIEYAEDPALRTVLKDQMAEYQQLSHSAAELLHTRGEEPASVGTVAKASAELMSAGKLLLDRSTSKIAEMTIQGNNAGISKTLQHLHDYRGNDRPVRTLANRLLSTEQANVTQLQAFL